jgi:hypothetical protein
MRTQKQIFYYSRRKLGLYFLFNVGLLALAILFTWSIFPDYQPIYYFALITCGISLIGSVLVLCIRLPVAKLDDVGIQIDHNQILPWSQIQSVDKISEHCWLITKDFLKIEPKHLTDYQMTFMQKISAQSRFGAFSVPLYAMDEHSALQIEKLIAHYMDIHSSDITPAHHAAKRKKD